MAKEFGMYDFAVFIGRFQPFHNGHKAVIDHGLTVARHVLVLIGSAGAARRPRNPWSAFKAQIAKTGGTLVERPDSGDPVQVLIDVIKLLMKEHGHTVNSKGCAVLPDYIRAIQGDERLGHQYQLLDSLWTGAVTEYLGRIGLVRCVYRFP
jgi:cytidyltransferase-like protein